MQLSTVILHVRDDAALQACKEWYIRLGLTPSAEAPGESIFFSAGEGMNLGIHIYDDAAPGAVTVFLSVDDVDREYERLLIASIDAEEPPEDRFWGRAFYVRDPAGHRIGIVSPAEG